MHKMFRHMSQSGISEKREPKKKFLFICCTEIAYEEIVKEISDDLEIDYDDVHVIAINGGPIRIAYAKNDERRELIGSIGKYLGSSKITEKVFLVWENDCAYYAQIRSYKGLDDKMKEEKKKNDRDIAIERLESTFGKVKVEGLSIKLKIIHHIHQKNKKTS